MSDVYVILKCSKCRSTMLLAMEGVRSDLFQCPVCLEGEIECEPELRGSQVTNRIDDGIHYSRPYIARPKKDAAN